MSDYTKIKFINGTQLVIDMQFDDFFEFARKAEDNGQERLVLLPAIYWNVEGEVRGKAIVNLDALATATPFRRSS